MSDETMREEFEAEFPPPVIIGYRRESDSYVENDSSDEAEECAFNQQLRWRAWQAARAQSSEPVAEYEHYPDDGTKELYPLDGFDQLPDGSGFLYAHPPARKQVPEGLDRGLVAEMLNDYANALTQGELDGAGHCLPGDIHQRADEVLAAAPQPQPDWIACSERLPADEDEDCKDGIWGFHKDGTVHYTSAFHVRLQKFRVWTHWKPTGLERPEPPAKIQVDQNKQCE